MPLIIHPSSCCDVCLDPFTYDEPRPPFAIPCGHIFCRDCLFAMQPSLCPLCRRPFIPDRSKKLITGDYDSDGDKTPLQLLKRLVVSWDDDTSETERTALVSEVDEWLGSGNTHIPLSKAHEVINAYHSLKSEEDNNRRSIRHLQQELEQLNISRMDEKERASAVEQSLLAHVEELHSKAAQYEAEIEGFRQTSRITFRHNPLPPPPEPYPLESLPSFARRYQNTNGDNINDPPDPSNGRSIRSNGVDRQGRTDEFTPLGSQNPHRRLERSSSQKYQRSTGADSGWFKNEVIPGASPGQRFVPNSVLESGHVPDASWTAPVDHSHFAHKEASAPYSTLPVGAEYSTGYASGLEDDQRQLPSSSRRPRVSRHVTDPPGLTQSPLLELPEGFQPSSRPHPNRARTMADVVGQELRYGDAPVESRKSSRRTRGMEDPHLTSSQNIASRALPVPPTPTSAPSYIVGSTSRQGDGLTRHSSSRALPSTVPITSQPTASTSAGPNARSTVPRPIPSPTLAPPNFSSNATAMSEQPSHRSSRARMQRRMSEATAIDSSWRPSNVPYEPPSDSGSSLHRRSAFSAQTITYPALQQANQGLNGLDTQRSSVAESYSSWGTVNTANPAPPSTQPIRASAHFVPAHDVISVHDLPLRSFEDVEGDTSRRGSLTSDRQDLQSSPARLDTIAGHSMELNHDTGNLTPRNLTHTHSLSDAVHNAIRSYSSASRGPERRRDNYSGASRDSEIAQAPPPVAPGIFYRPELTPAQSSTHTSNSSGSHRSSRTRHRMSQPDSTPSSSHWPETRQTITPTPAEGNALGLSDIAPSPGPRISAPTPVVSTKSFLQTFGQDRYH